jgi:hypothetical protein
LLQARCGAKCQKYLSLAIAAPSAIVAAERIGVEGKARDAE